MPSNKQDLREYSDAELSLIVFNDEALYHFVRRVHNLHTVRHNLEDMFTFTDEQWKDLVKTIEDDREEDEDAPKSN